MIRLHNSLGNKLEDFKPIKDSFVGMYHCGPTVYDFVHIGNLRAFLTADMVRRVFEYEGYEVKQVMNITDVGIGGDNDEGEDKMIKGLKREGKNISLESIKELSDFYTERFKEDISKLNIKTPHELPRASENISEDIEMIKQLEEKGFVYRTEDGVYFDTSKITNYGKLGGIIESDETESRIEENVEKKNKRDFALWKFNSSIGYSSPWGQGFPGWHIECSAMSTKYLGHTFDIHTGGIDLAPIHHNNEIAQSENACGCEYAHYWLHNGFVNVSGDKMAKSEGNFITLKTVEENGFSPLAYRYFLLLSHYRTPTNFSWEGLQAAQNALEKLRTFMSFCIQNSDSIENGKVDNEFKKLFVDAIENDLNMPEALAVIWKLVKANESEISYVDKFATLMDFDKVLGLKLYGGKFEIPTEIQALLNARESARTEKNFDKSDQLRQQIEAKGYFVKDTEKGQTLNKI
jgi:cysteinyl-tRNA synthetase